LFEFEDLSGFPNAVRQGMLDYLSWFLRRTRFYEPVLPLLRAHAASSPKPIVDLCSGGGGPWPGLWEQLPRRGDAPVAWLTDRFPNTSAYEELATRSSGALKGYDASVDATSVPATLDGPRTLFSAFHHFDSDTALRVMRDAQARRTPLLVVDGGDRHIGVMLGIAVAHPVLLVLCSPFLRPFRWDRLLFTYLVPLIPLCTVWDGIVSILHLYPARELRSFAVACNAPDYSWTVHTLRNRTGFRIHVLHGAPV
jgi:hypothetical protein